VRSRERSDGGCLASLTDFDYNRRPAEKLEVPIAERLAAHRSQKKAAAQRAAVKASAPARTGTPAPRPRGGAPAHGGGRPQASKRLGGHKPAHKPAHKPSFRGPSAHGRRTGGGPRGAEARLQAILDRHAPLTGARTRTK